MMSREELERGFATGRTVTQEEWANPAEIALVDELIAAAKAEVVAPWEYRDNFQCQRRRVRGVRL
jgi:hypothetical protein